MPPAHPRCPSAAPPGRGACRIKQIRARSRANFGVASGLIWAILHHCRPNLADVERRIWSNFGRSGAGTILTEIGPTLVSKLSDSGSRLAKLEPCLQRFRAILGRFRADVCRTKPSSGRNVATSGQLWSRSGHAWSIPGQFWRVRPDSTPDHPSSNCFRSPILTETLLSGAAPSSTNRSKRFEHGVEGGREVLRGWPGPLSE